MPVSLVPIGFPIAILVLALIISYFAKSLRKRILVWIVGVIALLSPAIVEFARGAYLLTHARGGNHKYEFEIARWQLYHCARINRLLIWPCTPDFSGAEIWLDRSANGNYAPAIYAKGVIMKYVNRGEARDEIAGQLLIDKARDMGFASPVEDKVFYMTVFRSDLAIDWTRPQ